MNIEPQPGRQQALASVAAIGSVLAASSCCLPVLPFLFAAGTAGSSAFLTTFRPYLLGASVLFVAYGFWAARRAKQCRRRPSIGNSILLWTSALLVVLSIVFPQVLADAAAGLLPR